MSRVAMMMMQIETPEFSKEKKKQQENDFQAQLVSFQFVCWTNVDYVRDSRIVDQSKNEPICLTNP